MKKNLLKNNGVQSLIASLVCIVLGLFIGYIVLLFINPTGAGNAIVTIVKNFMTYNRPQAQLKYMGNTLVKTSGIWLYDPCFSHPTVSMDTSLHRSSVSPAVPDDHVAVVYRFYLPLHVCAGPQAYFTEPGPGCRVRNLRMDHFFLPVFHLF